MNRLEKKMLGCLEDLRDNYNVIGIKAEFEAEGTRMEEALRLKEIVTMADLGLTIKIGGCEAVKDMLDAKVIGTRAIVGPMIETAYAMTKYVKTAQFSFSEDEREEMDFLINIETITGFENLDSITEAPEFEHIDGIVVGRVDMTGSLGLGRDQINSERIFEMTNIMAKKMQAMGKKLVVGGGVSAESLPFFRRLPAGSLAKYETRKIIFDATRSLHSEKAPEGLIKAVGFELMWLKNKRDFYGNIFKEDAERINMLETRYEKLLKEAKALCC
ncbi:citrate lyase beta subunit [Ruficoccus amylovorans]|uniref:Citrate lyase beta subunit n=1 Tax=Ruficoccus amylovorans TaxID=1804625 RepID=A0A842HAZ4_9BACT|nr:aldolase/citrate lyase family protein [Ruficoccus amylovorans]MBC2593450.1 citrate lyase beta subunit [Ruficoccus amylovorans]